MTQDYKVKDIDQAGFGRKEISLAETEMPGLMALRKEYKGKKPLNGAKILGCLHTFVNALQILLLLMHTVLRRSPQKCQLSVFDLNAVRLRFSCF